MAKKAAQPTSNRTRAQEAAGAAEPAAAPRTPVSQPSLGRRVMPGAVRKIAKNDEDEDVEEGPKEYPKTMYRKVPPSKNYPNGYHAKRFRDEVEFAKAKKAGWAESPADLTDLPERPFGSEP